MFFRTQVDLARGARVFRRDELLFDPVVLDIHVHHLYEL